MAVRSASAKAMSEKARSGPAAAGDPAALPPNASPTPSNLLQRLLAPLTPRWQNWVIRTIMSFVMIGSFSLIIYFGPLTIVGMILVLQMVCFREIICIGHAIYRSHDLPWFRTLSWFFLFASNYFFFGESMIDQFRILLQRDKFLEPLLTYHRFISFSLYCGGIVGFVVSLVKKHYLQQFTLFGWTHMALLFLITSSHLMIRNVFDGIIWVILPCAMIICNDMMAYVFGFFFGRTPLIKLSPKKTWEGFLGGGFSTIVFSLLLGHCLVQFDSLVCPIEYDEVTNTLSTNCSRHPVFQPVKLRLPFAESLIDDLGLWLGIEGLLSSIPWYQFHWHSICMATFASLVAPFGGFFASGFKRAFKIKDFSNAIPGHGGAMDRFDCQIIMGIFVYVYFQTFIMVSSPQHLLRQVYSLRPDDQLKFYEALTEGLSRRGIILPAA